MNVRDGKMSPTVDDFEKSLSAHEVKGLSKVTRNAYEFFNMLRSPDSRGYTIPI